MMVLEVEVVVVGLIPGKMGSKGMSLSSLP